MTAGFTSRSWIGETDPARLARVRLAIKQRERQPDVAQELGISTSGLRHWCRVRGIRWCKSMHARPGRLERVKDAIKHRERQIDVARELGLTPEGLRRWCRLQGIRWPVHRNSKRAVREAARRRAYRVVIDGREYTVKEIAKIVGTSESTIRSRLRAGWSHEDMLRPLRVTAKMPRCYELGITASDWEVITQYAKDRTINAASLKFGVPTGAIRRAVQGQWEYIA